MQLLPVTLFGLAALAERVRESAMSVARVREIHNLSVIELPDGFPDKYADAVVRAAEQCTVKKHFENPPVIRVDTALAV